MSPVSAEGVAAGTNYQPSSGKNVRFGFDVNECSEDTRRGVAYGRLV